ncbi:MAG: uridine kinase [Acidobacteria bacterium]|nr:uridine kinase [Acidobacteriota bacterium]
MLEHAPVVVGIIGASGSGKTTLARALVAALPADEAVILPLDAYYRDLSHLDAARRPHCNFDAPAAIDWPLFEAHLLALQQGHGVDRPDYDFTSHTRTAGTTRLPSRPVVVTEGVLLFCRERVRSLISTSVFLDVDDQTTVARRLARDLRERGRGADDVRAQLARDVLPMFERYGRPARRWATLTVSGTAGIAANVDRVLRALGRER